MWFASITMALWISTWAGRTDDKTECLLLQDNGKLILTGYFATLNGVDRAKIGRLNEDGTFDSLRFPPPSTILFGQSRPVVQGKSSFLADFSMWRDSLAVA